MQERSEGGADFPAALFLARKCQTLAFRAAGKSVKNFPAASKFARKLFKQGTLDSHSLNTFLLYNHNKGRKHSKDMGGTKTLWYSHSQSFVSPQYFQYGSPC